MRVAVIEDNPSLAGSLREALMAMEHAVDIIDDGGLAADILKREHYDLAVLDINLPGMNGFDILKSVRLQGNETVILILTARGDVSDRVTGLDLGADDYLTKPFELREFQARVRALLRRRESRKTAISSYGPVTFNTTNRMVFLDGKEVELTPRERGVLEALLRNYGAVARKEVIAEQIFSFNDNISISAIELYVHRLRKKIAHPKVHIRTVRGLGYLMDCEEV